VCCLLISGENRHQLRDRLVRKEEILYFCFDVLRFLESDEYSIVSLLSVEELASRCSAPIPIPGGLPMRSRTRSLMSDNTSDSPASASSNDVAQKVQIFRDGKAVSLLT
jgi:hypothetical protein